jgi:hypothetical protein
MDRDTLYGIWQIKDLFDFDEGKLPTRWRRLRMRLGHPMNTF